MKKYILMIAITFSTFMATAQQDTAKANATMNEATVYFGYGAELTHKAKVNITKNTKYIVIDKLSTQIDLNSLQISCPENVSLLSQQYSVYYPVAIVKPVITNPLTIKIQDSIKKANKEIVVLQNKIAIEQSTLAKTDKLIEATIATSANKTNLTAEVLKLIEFNNAKIEKNKNAIFNFEQDVELIQERLEGLNARLAIANNTVKTKPDVVEKPFGRITMQVVCRNEQEADLSMSYYTNNAGWQPIYDIRVNSKTNAIKLVYKASVIQNTGIDWTKTKLTLSTGTPNFTTTAPLFNPWYLQYYVPQLYNALQGRVAGLQLNKSASLLNSIQGYSAGSDLALKKELSFANDKFSNLDSVKMIVPSTLDEYTNLTQGLLNTSFEIDLPYDIASNGEAHSINIKEAAIQSNLKNYAVPKLDADAYLLAEITNWQNLDLIPGNANIIMDDTYIGKSFIDPNTTADTLNLSLGKDKRVGVKRTLVKDASLSKTKDANIKQTFTYELTVKNNKVKDVNVILKDQYPLSNVKEIEVELLNSDDAAINEELGVLTWKLTLKPGESRKVRFSYTVKYPKDKKIANLK
jgi:uncharacterized protein (TIGR02231 family)